MRQLCVTADNVNYSSESLISQDLCCLVPQCIPPDEACTFLSVDMILAMMQNKKTFTKPLAVITDERKTEGIKYMLSLLTGGHFLICCHLNPKHMPRFSYSKAILGSELQGLPVLTFVCSFISLRCL